MNFPPRSSDARLLAGVCAGLGRQYALDPTLVRLAFILLGLAWGLGGVVYLALWLVMPGEEGGSRSSREGTWTQTARENFRVMVQEANQSGRRLAASWHRLTRDAWPRPLSRRWIALGLIAGGLVILLGSCGAFSWVTGVRALGLAIVAVGAAALFSMRRE